MAQGRLANRPIWDDITTFSGAPFRGNVDIIYGGFPCQDISIAGLGKGLEGERSGLFLEIVRLAQEIQPQFVFLENVPAITRRGGLRVVRSLAELGYDCRWCIISAASIGAQHLRKRWFILANANGGRCKTGAFLTSADEATELGITSRNECAAWRSESQDQPPMVRVADEIPYWVDRTRALGNSVVPEQAEKAFKILMGIK